MTGMRTHLKRSKDSTLNFVQTAPRTLWKALKTVVKSIYYRLSFPVRPYVMNNLIWIDQGLNTVFAPWWNMLYMGYSVGPFGDPDETISSVLGRIEALHGGKIPKSMFLLHNLRWLLNKLDRGHTRASLELDEGRNALDKTKRYQNPHAPSCPDPVGLAKDCEFCNRLLTLWKI